ncbi:MAG TPA: DegT/DnrJ/EryC1/StrS family aminotransferase [Planctomycetota bacterium]|nr:DegT/DnrJ/EryC1/StrS family aminotransferase [Planctomycetota bacterium]
MTPLTKNIPVLDLSAEIAELWEDLNRSLQDVLKSGQFIMGPWVDELEKNVASYFGVKHAVAMNSGTDALIIGLRALGVQPGDEVITTPFTFFATAEAISLVGATPVFVDVDPATLNIDPAGIAAAVTARTKVIVPVHLFGHAADLDPILAVAKKHNLKVFEDTAQAFGGEYKGRKVGGLGAAGALSFYPTKNLGAYGDAGMLITSDDRVADTAKMLRVHGSRQRYHNEAIGYNSRMDSFQGAVLGLKLPHVDRWNELRRQWAGEYTKRLSGLKGIMTPGTAGYAKHVFHQYTIRVKADGATAARRDALQKHLADRGIGSMIYYPIPVHKLEVYAARGIAMPQAELLAREVLSLPLWPQMMAGQVEQVCAAIAEYAKK